VASSFGTNKDQFPGMLGMPRGIRQSDHAAKGSAIDNGALNAQCVTERLYVITPLSKIPSLWISSTATTITAMI
jgi:hypothetical protein